VIYDRSVGNAFTNWDPNGLTGPAGTALVVGATVDATATFTVLATAGKQQTTAQAPVLDGAVTLFTVNLAAATAR
jgi:hypothetical protein